MGCVGSNPEKKYLPNNVVTNPSIHPPNVAVPVPDPASANPLNNALNVQNMAEGGANSMIKHQTNEMAHNLAEGAVHYSTSHQANEIIHN